MQIQERIYKYRMEQIYENKKNAKTFNEYLDIKYGKIGTPKKDEFKNKARYFIDKEIIKEINESHLTQEKLVKNKIPKA